MSREALEVGSESKPPLLSRASYTQWKIRMEAYLLVHKDGKQISRSIKEGPIGDIFYPTDLVEVEGVFRQGPQIKKNPSDYTDEEKYCIECDA